MEETAGKNFAIVSRDEMNLAEFPLAVLSTRGSSTVKTLEFQDSVKGKNGELVNRQWIITGADKFGLPTSSDDEVLLGLLKLSVDDGFKSQKVYFTRYELLRALRWTTEGRNYQRLQKALDRLSGVRIKATNAFYDNVAKAHSTVNFGIIDGYEINDGRDSLEEGQKTSFFIWSETLFKSFQVGFIKKLDLDFYLGLKSAVTKRLYRYLDKHFWYKSKVQSPVFVLAHEKIGISRNFKYVSAIRQQLDPALDELVAAGFVERYEYLGKGSDAQVVVYAALGKSRVDSQTSVAASEDVTRADGPSRTMRGTDFRGRLLEELTIRGIKEPQGLQLIAGIDETEQVFVGDILRYFDSLVKSRSKLVSISPAGFLYKAIKERSTFVLPDSVKTPVRKIQPKINTQASLEGEYLEMRKREILRIRKEIEPALLGRMAEELERKLQAVRKALSPEGFRDAVEHGVNEQIARLYKLPEFDAWLRLRQSSGRGNAVNG